MYFWNKKVNLLCLGLAKQAHVTCLDKIIEIKLKQCSLSFHDVFQYSMPKYILII